jgi:hypothetical protein
VPVVPVPRTTDLHVIDPARGFTAWHNAVNSEPPSSRSLKPSLPCRVEEAAPFGVRGFSYVLDRVPRSWHLRARQFLLAHCDVGGLEPRS